MESTKSKYHVPVQPNEDKVFWQQHITAWSTSGISKIAYCKRHKVDYARFIYWSTTRQSSPHPKTPLIAVQLSSQQPQTLPQNNLLLCTLHCKNGNHLHIHDAQVLSVILDRIM